MSSIPISREHFLAHPRSRDLRQICLALAEEVHAFLTIPAVTRTTGEQRAASIAELRRALEAHGITPDMQTALPAEAYRDPIILTEYIAGQLLATTKHLATSWPQVTLLLEQERAQQQRDASRQDASGADPDISGVFMPTLAVLHVVCATLDAEEGPRPS